jgi:hypothetical protein
MFNTQHSKRNTQVSAAPARAHVERLTAAGYTPTVIARLAGVDHRRVLVLLDDYVTERGTARVADGTGRADRRILQRISDALLSVPVPAGLFVNAVGPVRRLRALVRIGYGFDDLAPVLGYDEALLAELALGNPEVIDADLADALADAFNRYHLNPGNSDAARELGRRHRWAAPLAWSVEEPGHVLLEGEEPDPAGSIDDPAAEPIGLPDNKVGVPSDFVEIVADHRALGHFDEDIAEALGLSVSALAKRLHRAKLTERRRGDGTHAGRPPLYGARYAIRLPWQVVA